MILILDMKLPKKYFVDSYMLEQWQSYQRAVKASLIMASQRICASLTACMYIITLQDNGLLLKRLRILLQQPLLKKYFHLPDRLQQLRHEKLIFYPRVVPQWTQNLPPFTILTLLTDEISHLPQKNATHDAKVNFLPQNSKH